ncbi:uncharacterized protein LOC119142911 [Falco rusticolus]|uniref:uncharacterized protein LOC119142911 n=1 Tax=Falco rusticolus TaxID=120794 RepID=UPI0018869525|nr:uncharacterized protein LOC119142911 [Falco rusticolus]
MGHHDIPTLSDMLHVMMLMLQLSLVSAILYFRRLRVGDSCTALPLRAGRVGWEVKVWGRELFPSPHPAAGVLQGRRKKTKPQTSTTRARFEEESTSPQAHGAAEKPTPTVEMGASLEASSVEHCSPETVPHSLSRSSSSSLNSPCSFPEPWPAATAEPASMNILGPQYSFKTICMLAGQPGLPTGFNIPLELPEGPKHEEFPTDGRDRAQSPIDVEPPPGSPSAMVTENLAEELIHIVQDALK